MLTESKVTAIFVSLVKYRT